MRLKFILVALLVPFCLSAQSAISYSYDAAGNRVDRRTAESHNIFAQTETKMSERLDSIMISFGVKDNLVAYHYSGECQFDNYIWWRQDSQFQDNEYIFNLIVRENVFCVKLSKQNRKKDENVL